MSDDGTVHHVDGPPEFDAECPNCGLPHDRSDADISGIKFQRHSAALTGGVKLTVKCTRCKWSVTFGGSEMPPIDSYEWEITHTKSAIDWEQLIAFAAEEDEDEEGRFC